MMILLMKNFNMPMPSNIYYWWNFGSLLGACLLIQILTGIFLSLFYENNLDLAFNSISQIERNINLGWAIRSFHANGASMFFIIIYLHMGRGLYFKSFYLNNVWMSGILILLILFMTAFLGYVLPWGQMSFWGATVITNLMSSLPYIGKMLTIWLWGNFSVSKATLLRFFTFHFILPFMILILMMTHIFFLHNKSSTNPLGFNSNLDKVPFQPYFFWKDYLGVLILLILYLTISMIFPKMFMDPDNFTPANFLSTPPHIQPEWYFLFAYAILRTVPNKLGGVLALFLSILIYLLFYFIPMINQSNNNFNNKIIFKFYYFFWMNNFLFLTFMGAMMIETPFIILSKISSIIYFSLFLIYL